MWKSSSRLACRPTMACTACNYLHGCLCSGAVSSSILYVGFVISFRFNLLLAIYQDNHIPFVLEGPHSILKPTFIKSSLQHFQFFPLPPACHSLWLVYRCLWYPLLQPRITQFLPPATTYIHLIPPDTTRYHLIPADTTWKHLPLNLRHVGVCCTCCPC